MNSLTAVNSIVPKIDRAQSLSGQIAAGLRAAILDGRLQPGARLPSWNDLADQLGVARGTVRAAYDTLADELLVVPQGPSGTHVRHEAVPPYEPLSEAERDVSVTVESLALRPGIPAQDALPAKLWSRLCTRAARRDAASLRAEPDPCGGFALREQIAAMLAITRSTSCTPDQIILTSGCGSGLWLTMLALKAAGKQAWYEDPGCPVTREGLRLAGVDLIPVPVDAHGLQVDLGAAFAPAASFAIVSPIAQGATRASPSEARRRDLLGWAEREGAWIVENDDLGGLQLARPAAPALAAHDETGRVILIGAFDQTLSPAVGLGFVVAPKALASRFARVAGLLNAAPSMITQSALADFLSEGHYLRHLRQMRRLYRDRKGMLEGALRGKLSLEDAGPLAVAAPLAAGVDDVALARRGLDLGIAPSPLSIRRHDRATARPGLLLGIANVHAGNLDFACQSLLEVVA